MHVKDPVALKRKLILRIISKGFCYHWNTEDQTSSPENWELDQE